MRNALRPTSYRQRPWSRPIARTTRAPSAWKCSTCRWYSRAPIASAIVASPRRRHPSAITVARSARKRLISTHIITKSTRCSTVLSRCISSLRGHRRPPSCRRRLWPRSTPTPTRARPPPPTTKRRPNSRFQFRSASQPLKPGSLPSAALPRARPLGAPLTQHRRRSCQPQQCRRSCRRRSTSLPPSRRCSRPTIAPPSSTLGRTPSYEPSRTSTMTWGRRPNR
mmetsp:Transcript_64923/g.145045  ORF Transcript_64923/g.145045 Transcript_64923/m.145045 type:complete len:224 (+) Transcript_64923:626-1297(+)